MEHIDLTLHENKSFRSVNEINNIGVDLEREEKLLPVSDLQGTIDAYEQYLKEKDACNKYRFVFTIHPYCTNVLFNHITEAVFKEGSTSCNMVLKENDALTGSFGGGSLGYATYKKNGGNTSLDSNTPITRDTGYSCDTTTGNDKYLEYYCGADIFNNHLLRRKEFVCINKLKNNENGKYFNTIFDSIRDPWGEKIKGFTYQDATSDTNLHLYNMDSIYSFLDGMSHNLREKDGWLGFYNQALLRTTNGDDANGTGNINKVINNLDECTFIDMYPTRKHYSFVPHVNPYRKRLEKNWEYMITYPFANEFNHFAVYDDNRHISGILCEPDLGDYTMAQWLDLDANNRRNIPLTIRFKTHMKHTLMSGDRVNIHFYKSDNNSVFTTEDVVIDSIGKGGYDGQHYFSVRLNDVSSDMTLAYQSQGSGTTIYARIEKLSSGRPCKYYLRKFRKLPNFKNTKTNVVNGVTEADITNALNTSDFSSSLNKLGFSKTIYGDDVAQIVYDDDIDVTGLRDNLDKELSVLYLTLVKTNYGHDRWYSNGTLPQSYTDAHIEYSHCFGTVTSGFNLPVWSNDARECNVRKQHNITKNVNGRPASSNKLESDITLRKDNQDYVFYGDIVELDENLLQETILERVNHRFNTAQREYDYGNKSTGTVNPFAKLITDEITRDDFNGGFQQSTGDRMCTNYWANLAPEGYYYQAHYPVKIKEFSDEVSEGYHTRIQNFEEAVTNETGNTYAIRTDVNYYFEIGDEIYLYNKTTNARTIGIITNVQGDDFRDIMFTVSGSRLNLSDYNLFKPNRLKPRGAYEMNDGTGRYVWRDIVPQSKLFRTSDIYDSIFTNGAIYMHKDINFYLKRQDPFGEYGLLPNYNEALTSCIQPADLEFDGENKDLSGGDYFEEGENNIC